MKISDLNKITLTDLKNYDWGAVKDRFLKNSDWSSVKDHVLRNPKPIVCALTIIITVTAVSLAYRIRKDVVNTQKTEIKELQKRAEAVEDFEFTKAQYTSFLAKVPEAISEDKLIEMLSEIALARGVQIISFSPARRKGNLYVSLTTVEITVASKSYTDTIRFVHDIENAPYSIRIGGWSGAIKMQQQFRQRFSRRQIVKTKSKKRLVEAKIEIETMEFKSE